TFSPPNTSDTHTELTCNLGPKSSTSASCSVDYHPTAVGSGHHTISTHYFGSSVHAPSDASTSLGVQPNPSPPPHPTQTSVSCSPTTLFVHQQTTCTATVTDTSSAPTT